MRRKCWRGIQQYNPLLRTGGAVGRVYDLPKKEGSHPLSCSTQCSPNQKEEFKHGAEGLCQRSQELPTIAGVSDSRRKGFLLTPLCLIHFLVERDEMLNCCSRR